VIAVQLLFAAFLAASPTGSVEGTVHFEQKSLVGSSEVKGAQAVVFLDSLEGPDPVPTEGAAMKQKDKSFEPRLLVVMQGSKVAFPNDDLIFHNVFSLTRGSEFDLGVYRQGSSKSVHFKNPGVVDVFCNIHPEMIASILVLQNPHWVRVGDDGRFSLELPAGKHSVVVYWSSGVMDRKDVEVTAGGKVPLDFTLVDTGRVARHMNKFGQQYGRYK
jgi:plastocyanin